MENYLPIENHGIVGDLNTIALVGINGCIDFMCFPDFDSPTIFAAILDKDKGGQFSILPTKNEVKQKQLYLPDTNVLLTRFLSKEGVGEITDFMPVQEVLRGKELIRRVTCVRGEVSFKMDCCIRFNYALTTHQTEQISENEIIFKSNGEDQTVLKLQSNIPLLIKEGDAHAEFTLKTGEKIDFILSDIKNEIPKAQDAEVYITQSLYETINYWKNWVDSSTYRGRWREVVNRSTLVLKLLTSHKFGSVIAAPTFGLPEEIGGERNWDYRYTWIRDASFTVYTLLNMGYKKEAREFMNWVEKQCNDIGNKGYLSLMYSLEGNKELHEKELTHLEGYKGSFPVRIGNGAYRQVQHDIYGELLDAVYLYDTYVEGISYDFWEDLARQVDWVCENWQKEDEGIWEVRGGKKQFLYSIMMCWVAIDRAMKIAHKHSFPMNDRWILERDKIFKAIHQDFWNNEQNAFVQYKGADTVDAATLLMPLINFISPKDPKWLSTLKKIEEDLVSDSLVYRYRNEKNIDGLKGGEGTFSMCTFWYVECLALSGDLNKARLYFEKMLGYSNHLGLYAEQLGFQGEHLGNFPQAFTHLGLISAALSLDRILNDQRNKEVYN